MSDQSEPKDKKINKTTNLKDEWSLLMSGFVDDVIQVKTSNHNSENELNTTSSDKIKNLLQTLSQTKHGYIKKIEDIKLKREVFQIKVESKNLTQHEMTHLYQEINLLNQQGRNLSQKLEQIDHEIKIIRDYESKINNSK